ncbi:unnamed protein product [Lepeophtheirus salmonis]|uniref:(salmon louse) hypothetical protein n=1 Tax=Lepeophtheirus salmonis TaxID=72036 RepID=A0A7R8H315_LEPSM|nr:unnamed protein product [Lepeophtheirus salmonis]CAF2837150.1 unnamed protein product [Lepeophtheirus salmonis]
MEHFDLGQHQRPNNMESYCQDHPCSAANPLESSPLEDIMEFSLRIKSDESFPAHPEEYIIIKKYQDGIIYFLTTLSIMLLTSKVRAWSDKTIKKPLQLRLAWGTSVYQMLISHGNPPYCNEPALEYNVGDVIFVLVGVKTRWKQVGAYHFTGSSFDKKDVALAVKEIAIAAHKSGIFSIVPHLLKNVCNHLNNGQDITLAADIVSTYKLPSSMISLQPFQDLILFQRDRELKLQPRLSIKSINLGNFEKMKVVFASDLLSPTIGSAIRFLVYNFDSPESYLTVAWFSEQVGHWFDRVTSRNFGTAPT